MFVIRERLYAHPVFSFGNIFYLYLLFLENSYGIKQHFDVFTFILQFFFHDSLVEN